MPAPNNPGRPRKANLRELINALYVVSAECQWQMLPKDFPPNSTVQGYGYEWRETCLWRQINHHLVVETRELEGKEALATLDVISGQSDKTTERVRIMRYDADRKIKGRKRRIFVNPLGL